MVPQTQQLSVQLPIADIGPLLQQITNLSQENTLLRQKIGQYEEQTNEKDARIQKLSDEILRLSNDEIKSLKTENDQLSEMVAQLQKENAEFKQKHQELEDKLVQVNSKLEKLEISDDSIYVGQIGYVLEKVIVKKVFKDSGLSDWDLGQIKISDFYNSNPRKKPEMPLELDEAKEFTDIKNEIFNQYGMKFETVFQSIIEIKKQRIEAHKDPLTIDSLTINEILGKIDNIFKGASNTYFKKLANILQQYNGVNLLKQ